MVISSEAISKKNPPKLGDTVVIRKCNYLVCATAMGYYLADVTGKRNIDVGMHQSLRTLVDAIISQNTWNTHLSYQRTHDLAGVY